MITNEVIGKLNPCTDRFNNYLKHYSNKIHTAKQFMGLKNITHSDKLWVSFRLMNKDKIRFAVADIAESVLHIFEEKYPNDNRPRRAIEAVRKGNKDAAYAAAHDADNAAAYAAAKAAHAAAKAAHAANKAAYAADYAAYYAARAAYYAAYASADAAVYAAAAVYAYSVADKIKQEKLVRTIILKYWKE